MMVAVRGQRTRVTLNFHSALAVEWVDGFPGSKTRKESKILARATELKYITIEYLRAI
jgi:hypothetical protein